VFFLFAPVDAFSLPVRVTAMVFLVLNSLHCCAVIFRVDDPTAIRVTCLIALATICYGIVGAELMIVWNDVPGANMIAPNTAAGLFSLAIGGWTLVGTVFEPVVPAHIDEGIVDGSVPVTWPHSNRSIVSSMMAFAYIEEQRELLRSAEAQRLRRDAGAPDGAAAPDSSLVSNLSLSMPSQLSYSAPPSTAPSLNGGVDWRANLAARAPVGMGSPLMVTPVAVTVEVQDHGGVRVILDGESALQQQSLTAQMQRELKEVYGAACTSLCQGRTVESVAKVAGLAGECLTDEPILLLERRNGHSTAMLDSSHDAASAGTSLQLACRSQDVHDSCASALSATACDDAL
jgi:hypothetical protein